MTTQGADRLGFGCASLFALPSPSRRRAVLEHAYDLGIRHFDVAPIYGLGRAEVELAKFRSAHPDICVATKFGLSLTPAGRLAGLVQRPIRAVLSRRPGLQDQVKESGKGPDSGSVGSALYRGGNYSVIEARAALDRSRRMLGVERIDTFLAHEPAVAMTNSTALVDFLREQQQRGTIDAWGPAGELPASTAAATSFYAAASVVQYPYNLSGGPSPEAVPPAAARILFGFLSGALPALRRLLTDDRGLRDRCADALGRPLDLAELPALLLRDAIRAANGGRVLLSTTKTSNLDALCAAAAIDAPDEREVCAVLTTALDPAGATS